MMRYDAMNNTFLSLCFMFSLHVALRSDMAHIRELRFLYSFVRDRADFRGDHCCSNISP